MDCGFYIVYLNPNSKTKSLILNFWEAQLKISDDIRKSYDREIENKFVSEFKNYTILKNKNEK